MKTKKQIINSLSILTIGIIFALVGLIINRGQNKNNYFLIVGDKIGNNEYVDSLKNLNNNELYYDTTFTSNNLSSTQLLKFVNQNAQKNINGKMVKINDLIKNSQYMCLSVGSNDLNEKIILSDNVAEYDMEILYRQIQITSNNVYNIIYDIKDTNPKIQIVILGVYFPYIFLDFSDKKDLETIYENYNNNLKEIANSLNINYLDLTILSNEKYYENNSLSLEGNECLAKKIYSCIIDSKC